jgi:membrane protease YdiL (CAAX protease family)
MSTTHTQQRPTTTQAQPRQYSLLAIITTWAAAALPMAALAWVVAPLLARSLDGPQPLVRSLILTLTVGLIWQFVLVLILVRREQQTLRWSAIKDALWLHSPTSPRTGRRGGRVWLIVLPLILLFGIEEELPTLPPVASHRLNTFLESQDGQSFLSGNWTWLIIIAALVLFNTVLGEELLFRGLLLPRMNKVFGRWDGLANGVLFAAYHLHMPWAIPWTLLDTFLLSYPSKWTRSALIGIVVHSAQSVVILWVTARLVLS